MRFARHQANRVTPTKRPSSSFERLCSRPLRMWARIIAEETMSPRCARLARVSVHFHKTFGADGDDELVHPADAKLLGRALDQRPVDPHRPLADEAHCLALG